MTLCVDDCISLQKSVDFACGGCGGVVGCWVHYRLKMPAVNGLIWAGSCADYKLQVTTVLVEMFYHLFRRFLYVANFCVTLPFVMLSRCC